MATMAELARSHTSLNEVDLDHLQRLVASWGMLSDLCFSDLLLLVPVSDSQASRFVVLDQMRPTTNPTLYRDDLVGHIVDEEERPFVSRAWQLGTIVEGEAMIATPGEYVRWQCIPVRWHDELLAVLTRESAPSVSRRQGELERVYVETFDRFAAMIVAGDFPFLADPATVPVYAPRVGDGVVILDRGRRVEYASPNAVNALHRMGLYSNIDGMRLEELGIETSAVDDAFVSLVPVTEEIERPPDVIVVVRCLPLIEAGQPTGALVLLRDVSDLRRRDRMLVTMDATIREVHHRVKNNLQTITSLLRLQARRLEDGPGRIALQDAERRIRSIALVHEILSRETGDRVDFNEIVLQLVRMAEEGVFATDQPVAFEIDGDAGDLPASLATSLGVVLTELLQNAAEHAFPEAWRPPAHSPARPRVEVTVGNDGAEISLVVRDNGVGWPQGFSIEASDSLGLSIVRSLVTSQLGGTLELHNDGGAVAELRLPVKEESALPS
jgi:two-component sensor histidine kinase